MRLSIELPETSSLARASGIAVAAERDGFDTFFLGAAFGFDPIMALLGCAGATREIRLGTAVIPAFARHPLVMAQQALTAQAATGGRFRLGIGTSHEPVMAMYGIDFDRPVGRMRDYLEVLRALLLERRVKYRGQHYSVSGMVDVEGVAAPPPVLVAALRPQMARLAGEFSDGIIPWLASAEYVRDVLIPAAAEGADRAGRSSPPIIASVPVILAASAAAALAVAQRDLAIYPHMPFYRAVFEASRVSVPADATWTHSMLDAATVWGDTAQITQGITRFFDAGAAEVICSPFGSRDLAEHLGRLAKEM